MKILIVEDDFTSRVILQEILKETGLVHLAVDGKEAVRAVKEALENKTPYHLILLDIMMPEMDGQLALKEIRALEERHGYPFKQGAKVIMTTALGDPKNVMTSFHSLCDAYIVKPIDKALLQQELRRLGLTA